MSSIEFCREAVSQVQVGQRQKSAEVPRETHVNTLYHNCDEGTLTFKETFEPQSGTPADASIIKMGSSMKSQNIQFKDKMEDYTYVVGASEDPTRSMEDSSDVTLQEFFSRPVVIRDIEWGTGADLNADFDPWQAFIENPRVYNRINNYELFRGKLHIKAVINGNGFQYGRAILAYSPLDKFDELSTHSALVKEDLVQTSQLPHVYLDPTTSTGGSMVLPFFYHENYVSMTDGGFKDLGKLYLRSINNLKHANDATDVATVTIFAWLEDVQLSVPTSVDNNGLSAQSGKESEVDEANTKGMISGPATTVANAANALSVVPQLKPFALATSAAATGVAAMAKLFGYSRPPNTENPCPYRPMPISQLATTTTPDTAMKLTVDDKQELTVDTTIAGLSSSDPMVIADIAKRESYLTTFDWAIGTSQNSLLWNARVDPCLWTESDGGDAYHFPALAFAALPFKYWRGSLKFRFQIVCSAFHKGRLKFAFDPGHFESAEFNTNYIEIVDISESQDFTIELGHAQSRALLTHLDPGLDSPTEGFSTTNYTNTPSTGNGTMAVYVLNELTTPNSTSATDIEINVYVSGGDDFEVFVPTDDFQSFVFKPQSGFEKQSGSEEIVADSQETNEPSAPLQTQTEEMAMPTSYDPKLNMVYTGECIRSFRPLLKRYNLWRRELISGSLTEPGDVVYRAEQGMYPFLRGNVTDAVDLTGADDNYNYCNTILMHWLIGAHAGFRGSVRYKLLFDKLHSSSNDHRASRVYVERLEPTGSNGHSRAGFSPSKPSSNSEAGFEVVRSNVGLDIPTGTRGSVYATDAINPNIEFEVPYQTNVRFKPGKPQNLTEDCSFECRLRVLAELYCDSSSIVDWHVAGGEDFQVYFWTGLPRMYREASPPNP